MILTIVCIASCRSNDDLVEQAHVWNNVHGPRTRVFVNQRTKCIYITWGRNDPVGMVAVDRWLIGKERRNGKAH